MLRELDMVTGSDFEAVDVSSLMLDPDSGQAHGDGDSDNPDNPASVVSGDADSGAGGGGSGCFINTMFPGWFSARQQYF